MLIVDVCAFYSPQGGGVKTYVEQKIKALPALGHDIAIVIPGDDARVERIGPHARIIHLRSPAFPLDRRYRYFDDEATLHATLDLLQPDVVEASSPWSSSSMVARWHGRGLKAMIMHADPLASYAYRWLHPMMSHAAIDRTFRPWWNHIRALNDQFDLIVCANESLTNRLANGGVDRAITIPMGIESDVFSPTHRDPLLRNALLATCDLTPDALLLVAIGRMASEKRLIMLVDATVAAGQSLPVGLLLIGDGPERSRVERHIAGNPHIRLMPPERNRARLASILASADALIHGCESETFGMVAAEARASGLPLIVPDTGGANAQLIAGAGIAYKAANTSSLTGAILQLANMDQLALRAAAIEASHRSMNMADHFGQLCDQYTAILGKHSCAA